MKAYLLDTHAFLWSVFEPARLGSEARAVLSDVENTAFVSSVTFWEVALKASLGKLTLTGCSPDELPDVAERMGFKRLGLDVEEAATFHRLPRLAHKDPFDRMLIWQSIRRQLILVSGDEAFEAYREFGLQAVW